MRGVFVGAASILEHMTGKLQTIYNLFHDFEKLTEFSL